MENDKISNISKQNIISLCYYRKNVKVPAMKKNVLSNFVVADRNGKFLKFSPEITQHYLPLGNLTGVLRFIRPMVNYT